MRRGEQRQPLLVEDEHPDGYVCYDDDDLAAAAKLRRKRERVRVCVWISVAVFVIALVGVGLYFGTHAMQSPGSGSGGSKAPALLGTYKKAAVASDVTQCSEIGRDILQKGGNAVDAGIAALLCMGLTDPQSMGIGGGFFMTVYNRTEGKSYAIDARETAPLQATENMFVPDDVSSSKGCLSIAVPGEIKGYWTLNQRFGRLPWKDLFKPAIDMATNGFKVPKSLESALDDFSDDDNLEFKATYTNPDTGMLYREGELLRMPKLAKTLQTLADEGQQAFYNGSLTDDIIEDIKQHEENCIITKEDLWAYADKETDSLDVALDGDLRLLTPSDPSGGPILAFILQILDGYNMTADMLSTETGTVLAYHRITEAFKFAYAKRTDLADGDFVDGVEDLVKNLTSRAYADAIRSLIWDNQTHSYEYYGPHYYDGNKTSTAHLSVLDEAGNAVSVTSTVNQRFGSGVIGKKTGIVFNDEMDDFSTPNKRNYFGLLPSPANFIKPGKRPLSSMCPAIIVDKDGVVQMVVGAAGGSRITTATAFVTSLVHWFNKNIQEAIDAPRLHHQLSPPDLDCEKGMNEGVIAGLKAKGHNVTMSNPGKSIVQGIVRQGETIYAYSDQRKGGTPAGY